MTYAQIIVLGNGFDLVQGIPSSYDDFFNYRYKQYQDDNNSINSLLPKISEQSLYNGYCIWDYLFAFWHDSEKELHEWKNVESAIKEWVVGTGTISLTDAISYWEAASKCNDVQSHNYAFDVQSVYDLIKYYLSDKIDFSVLDIFANKEDNLQDSNKQESIDEFRKETLNIFASELHVIEDAFADYLDKAVKYNYSYEPACYATYVRICEAGGTNIPLEKQSNSILSFNYTVPLSLFKEPSVHYIQNVHGDLARREDELLSNRPYHVIFGFDSQSHMDDPSVYQFTKTARILTLEPQHKLDGMQGFSLFDAQKNGGNIAEIKFFGHSLGEADYSYFQSLFDRVDLYGSDIKLTFCGTKKHPANKDAIIQLITKYSKTITPQEHGHNLLHKLRFEGRLKIEEISPL